MTAEQKIRSGNYNHYDVVALLAELEILRTERNNAELREYDLLGRANEQEKSIEIMRLAHAIDSRFAQSTPARIALERGQS